MAFSQTVNQLLILLVTPITFILSLLPSKYARRLQFSYDILISGIYIFIGRLLPTLTTPSVNLHSKTAIVTGANSGIGLQLATDLARQGATVILACRDLSKAKTAITTIHWRVPASAGRVKAMQLDTSSFESVRAFAETWTASNPSDDAKRIDIICHNAGIAMGTNGKELTDDGLDVMYATNLLGSFLLTYFLEPCLSSDARVVFTSSTGQYGGGRFSKGFAEGPVRGVIEPGFHSPIMKLPILGWQVVADSASSQGRYSNTKSMQCALARCLQRRWDRQLRAKLGRGDDTALKTVRMEDGTVVSKIRGRTAHAFTPGYTFTPIFGKWEQKNWSADLLFGLLKAATALAIDVEQGAMTGSWLASTEDESVVGFGNGGGYWDRMTRRLSAADMFGDQLLGRLWARWERDAGITWR